MGNSQGKNKVAPQPNEPEPRNEVNETDHQPATLKRRQTGFNRQPLPPDEDDDDDEAPLPNLPVAERIHQGHQNTIPHPELKSSMKKPDKTSAKDGKDKSEDKKVKRKTGIGDLPFYKHPNIILKDIDNAIEAAAENEEHRKKQLQVKEEYEAKKRREALEAQKVERLKQQLALKTEEAHREHAKRRMEKNRRKASSFDKLPKRGEPGYVPPEVRRIQKAIKSITTSGDGSQSQNSSSSDSDHLYEPNARWESDADRKAAYLAERERQRLNPKIAIDVPLDPPERVMTIHTIFGRKYPHVKRVDKFFGHLQPRNGRKEVTFEEKVWYLFHPLERVRELEDIQRRATQPICIQCFDRTPEHTTFRRTRHMQAPPEPKRNFKEIIRLWWKKSTRNCLICKTKRKRGGAGEQIDKWNQEHPSSWNRGEYHSELDDFEWDH